MTWQGIEKESLYSHLTHTRKADKTLNIHLPSFPTKQSGPWATFLTCVRDFGLVLKFVTSSIFSLSNSDFPIEFKTLAPGILISKKCKIYHTVNYKCLKYDFSSPPPNSNDAFLKSLINDLIINFKLSLWALFYPLFEHIWRKLVLYKTFFSTIVISSEKKIF